MLIENLQLLLRCYENLELPEECVVGLIVAIMGDPLLFIHDYDDLNCLAYGEVDLFICSRDTWENKMGDGYLDLAVTDKEFKYVTDYVSRTRKRQIE